MFGRGLARAFVALPILLLMAGCITMSALGLPKIEEEELTHAGRYDELLRLYERRYTEDERRIRLAKGREFKLSDVFELARYQLFLRAFPVALIETGQLDRARIELNRSTRELELLEQAAAASSRTSLSKSHRVSMALMHRTRGYLDWFQTGSKSNLMDPLRDPGMSPLTNASRLPLVVERAFVEEKIFGNHQRALEYLDKALAIAKSLDLTDIDSKYAYSIQAIRRKAWIQMRLGRLSDAKASLQEYEQIVREPMFRAGALIVSKSEYFRGYLSMMSSTAGAVHAASRDFEAARRHFDVARESLKDIPPDSPHMWDRNARAAYHVLYGAYFLGLLERYVEASKEVDDGLRYLRPAYIDALLNEIDIESAYLLSAQLHVRTGQHEMARTRAQESRRFAERYRSVPAVAAADGVLGALLVQQGRPRDALVPLEGAVRATRIIESTDNWFNHYWLGRAYTSLKRDDAAIAQYLSAVNEVEKLWNGRFEDIPRQLDFIGERFTVYEVAIEALVDRGKFEDAFAIVERSKARTAYEVREAEASASGETPGNMPSRRRPQSEPLRYTDVRALLPADTALLEYYVGSRSVIGFAINGQRPLLVKRLSIAPDALRTKVARYGMVLRFDPGHRHVRLGQELYTALVKPFEASTITPILGIVPHGALHALPFHALVLDPSDPRTSERGLSSAQAARPRYLIERHAIFYAPSATLLSHSKRKEQHARDSVLVVAGPPAVDATDLDPDALTGRLENAESEGRSVAKLFPKATVFTDAAASETNAKRSVKAHSNILFAAHALVVGRDPLRSTVLLARDATNDGRFSVREIEAQPLSASLIFLSACTTGEVSDYRGSPRREALEYSLGDDLVSINRAFLKAGASSVVSTLWPVHDAPAHDFVVGFFRRYVAGASRAEALRAASLEKIARSDDAEASHTRYWTPFFLSGDWR